MDTPCHVLTGFVLGHAVQPVDGDVSRPGPLFTTLVSVLPDVDFFLQWFGMSTYLTYHRAFLNSVFLLPPIILLFALGYGWLRGRASTTAYVGVGLLVGGVHVFMDLLNTFGSPVFFPFSFSRYALDLVFIVDIYVYALLLIPVLGRFLQGRWSPWLARCSFVLIGGYLLFSLVSKHQAQAELEQLRQRQGIASTAVRRVGVTPQPLFPVHWSLILQHEEGSRQVFINSLTGRRYADDDRFEEHREAFELLKQGVAYDRDARVFEWFARYPVVLEESDRDIIYGDLQFNVKVNEAVRTALTGGEGRRSLPFRFRCDRTVEGRPAFEWIDSDE